MGGQWPEPGYIGVMKGGFYCDMEEFYDINFPNLRGRWKRTSDPEYYSCIAYGAGDYKRQWWPGEYHPFSTDYWPRGIRTDETIQAFQEALATVGYEGSTDGTLEPGI